MPQFDAFPHPVPSLRKDYPLAVNLRSDVVPGAGQLIIAPLAPRARFGAVAGRLAPIVRVDAEDYVVIIEHMNSIPARAIPPRIANLASNRESLIAALDLLFSGF